MNGPTLVAVAHGTRDPHGPAAVEGLLDGVRLHLPDIEVVGAYVELVRPSLPDVLRRLRRPAVVVPLLLSTGYHVRTDLPAAAARARAPVVLAPPLGPSPLLAEALLGRISAAGAEPGDPVVLGAAGSSDPAAAQAVRHAARLLARRWAGPVTTGFLSAARPSLDAAVQDAVLRTGRAVTVAPYLLAPGRFSEELAETARRYQAARCADVLAGHPRVADLVAQRYREHAAQQDWAQTG